MAIRDFVSLDTIGWELTGTTRDDVLKELVALLSLEDHSGEILFKMLQRVERLTPTGIGRGIAMPHTRSIAMGETRLVFGRRPDGVDFYARDGEPVRYFFMVVGPPLESTNELMPLLGQVATLVQQHDLSERLDQLETPAQLLQFLQEVVL